MADALRTRSPEPLEDEKVDEVLVEHTQQRTTADSPEEPTEPRRVDLAEDLPSASSPTLRHEYTLENRELHTKDEALTDHRSSGGKEDIPGADGGLPAPPEGVQEPQQPQTTTTLSPEVVGQEKSEGGVQGSSTSSSLASRSTNAAVPEEEDGDVRRGGMHTQGETEGEDRAPVRGEEVGEDAPEEKMKSGTTDGMSSDHFSSPIVQRASHPSALLPKEEGKGAPESTSRGSSREGEEEDVRRSLSGSGPSTAVASPEGAAERETPPLASEAQDDEGQGTETQESPIAEGEHPNAATPPTPIVDTPPHQAEREAVEWPPPPPPAAVVAAPPVESAALPSVAVPPARRLTSTSSDGRRAIRRSIDLLHRQHHPHPTDHPTAMEGKGSRGGSGHGRGGDCPVSAILSPPLFNTAYATPGEEYHRFRQHYKVSPSYTGPIYVPENVMVMCSGCGGPLDPVRRVPVGKLFFHIHCVHCFLCGARRVEEPYFQVGNQAVCSNCAEKGDARCVPKEEAGRRNITLGALKGNAYNVFDVMDYRKRRADASATLNYATLPNVYPPSLSIGTLHNRRNTTRRTFELLQRQQHYTQNDCNMIFALPPPAPPSSSVGHTAALQGGATVAAITSGRTRCNSAGSRDSRSSSGSRSHKKSMERKKDGGGRGGVPSPKPPSSSSGRGSRGKWGLRQGEGKEGIKFRRKEQDLPQRV